MTRVLIVGGGPFQCDMIRTAARMGLDTVVVDRDPRAPGLSIATRAEVVDIIDADAVVAVARSLAIDAAVTTASDAALPALAAVVESLGLSGPTAESVRRSSDKLATFESVRDRGLRAPPTTPIRSEEDAMRAVRSFGFPCVLKPRSAAGGRGVTIVRDGSEVAGAFAQARRYEKRGEGVLAQAFAAGVSVGVEAFFAEGRLVSAFVMDDAYQEGFVSPIGHAMPPSVDVETERRLWRDVEAFGAACAVENGPANFDLRLDQDQTVLIEVNARLGGNSITDLVRASYGVDLSEVTLRVALGQDVRGHLTPRHEIACASRLLVSPKRGVLRGAFRDGCQAEPDVLLVDLTAEIDRETTMTTNGWSILGRVIVQGASPADATARAEAVARDVLADVRIA